MTFKDFDTSKYSTGLNEGQRSFFRAFLETGRNLFLTGGAGVGKSYVTKILCDYAAENGIVISKTASTGVAAINIGAQTLHSFLGIGLADCDANLLIERVKKNKLAKKRIADCRVLLIDEISMVSGELFDKVHEVIKFFSRITPRVIVVGDFLQLPPVMKTDKTFCFDSNAWDKLDFKIVHLTEIVRQNNDQEFAKLLSGVRFGDRAYLSALEPRFAGSVPENGSMVVFSKNVDVDQFNEDKLNKLPGQPKRYYAVDNGPDNLVAMFDKNCLAPTTLKLKPGAQVMLLKNDNNNGLSNGSVGKVVSCEDGGVTVDFGDIITLVTKDVWKIDETFLGPDGKVKTKTLASREQIPLKLAYSCTSHKVQGLTIDKVTLDLSGCFAPGQFYTALSRARRLEDLTIVGFSPSSLRTDPRCVEFYNNL